MNELEKLPCCGIQVCDRCGRRDGAWLIERLGCSRCIDGSAMLLASILSAAREVDRSAWTSLREEFAIKDRLTNALAAWDEHWREVRRQRGVS